VLIYFDMDLVTGYGDSDSEGECHGTCSIEECEDNSNMNSSSSNNNNNSIIHKQTVLDRNSTVTVADPSIASTSLITTSSVNRSIHTISAPTTTSSSVLSVSASSTVTVDKKRKKFDISILPIEIQHALARGDTLKDSDDDEEVTKVTATSTLSREVKKKHSDPSNNSSSSSRSSSSSSSSSCPLLSLLPNPKIKNNVEVSKLDLKSTSSLSSQPVKGPIVHTDETYLYGNDDDGDDDDDDKYKVKRSGITSDISTTTKHSSKSTFSFGYVTTEETRIDKNGTSSVSNSLDSSGQKDLLLLHHHDDDDDVDHDNTSDWSMKRVKGSKSGVNPWFHADSKRSTAEVEYCSMMMISSAT